jgi:hypothetical protein
VDQMGEEGEWEIPPYADRIDGHPAFVTFTDPKEDGK